MFKKLLNAFKSLIFPSSRKQDFHKNNIESKNWYTTYFEIKVSDGFLSYFEEQLKQNELTSEAQESY